MNTALPNLALYHPKLPFDVILEVLSHADLPTAVALSSLARDYRRLGAKDLLKHPIQASTSEATTSLLSYLHGGSPNNRPRASRIRSLVLNMQRVQDLQEVGLLVNAIAQMREIKQLTLIEPERAMKAASPALAALPGLENFSIQGVGAEGVKLLKRMKSRPTNMVLEASPDIPSGLLAISRTLIRHRKTLEVLTLRRGTTICGKNEDTPKSYPRVRTLNLRNCPPDNGDEYMLAFPGLKTLDAGNGRQKTGEVLAIRECNKEATSDVDGRWTNLKLVRGGIFDLLVLGNTLRTRVLEILGWFWDHIERVAMLVDDCRPKTLRLCVASSRGINKLRNAQSLNTVKNLTLTFCVSSRYGRTMSRPEAVLRKLLSSFTRVECVHVNLTSAFEDEPAYTKVGAIDLASLGLWLFDTNPASTIQLLCMKRGEEEAWIRPGADGAVVHARSNQFVDEFTRREMFSDNYPF